jgi:protein TonB
MFEEPVVNIGGKRKYTVLVSIVTHTLIIAAAIIVPVVATDSFVLPTRFATMVFPTRPPVPPSPPQPKGVTKERSPVTTPTVPVVAPELIVPESPIQLTTGPVDGFNSVGLVTGGDYVAPPALPAAPVPDQIPQPIGGDIKPPVKVRDTTPTYPSIARAAHVEGIVIVEATIGPDGKVQNARILRSIPLLDAAALDAVRQWEYTPTRLNGTPIAIVMTVTVNFKLR